MSDIPFFNITKIRKTLLETVCVFFIRKRVFGLIIIRLGIRFCLKEFVVIGEKTQTISKGGSVQTTVRKLKWGDDPKIRKTLESIRPKGAVQISKPQHTPREMLFIGMDMILQNRMRKGRLRQSV